MKDLESEQLEPVADLNAPQKLSSAQFFEIGELASGMIRDDLLPLLLLYPLLILPQILATLSGEAGGAFSYWALPLTERLVQIAVFYFICRRWANRLKSHENPGINPNPFSFLLLGLIFWAFVEGPVLTILWLPESNFRLFFPMIWTICLILTLRFYFYFLPLMLGQRSLKEALGFSSRISQMDFFLPIRVMLAPFAIMTFLSHLISAFSPDERWLLVRYLLSFSSGLFFVLSSYLSIATGLTLLSTKQWREFQLDPYRRARLETLKIRGNALVARLLLPKNGVKILVLAVLIAVGNLFQLNSTPPTAKIKVEKIFVSDNLITLEISASDPEFKLRGLNPHLFAVAGNDFELISENPLPRSILVNGKALEGSALSGAPEAAEARFTIAFAANRKADELTLLKDLNLWYRRVKIEHLSMKTAEIKPNQLDPEAKLPAEATTPVTQ